MDGVTLKELVASIIMPKSYKAFPIVYTNTLW